MGKRDRGKAVSPFKRPRLNTPGETIREHRLDVALKGLIWTLVTAFAGVWAVTSWAYWLCDSVPQPWIPTIIAVPVAVYTCWYQTPRLMRRLDQLDLGAAGEIRVAEALDGLKQYGYRVFHDIPEDGYNIDHILIGPGGVFVIETKTRSKHENNRDVQVTYDGERVLVDGHAPDRDPIKQVNALADHVRDVLRDRADARPHIRPVILYPGWWVEVSR